MHFTQEDYRSIENYLQQRTVRDSDLPPADELTGSELITVVQDGHNKVMYMHQLKDQLNQMNIPDFVNVSNRHNEFNISLDRAIELVPSHRRVPGIVLTFLGTDGCWEIVQFKGAYSNQWYNMNLWGSLFSNYIDSHVYFPDEEDIEGVQDGNRKFLKLKDKPYDEQNFSGKGRKFLRQHLVGIEACSFDDEDHYENIITQEDFPDENTIYVLRYDYILKGHISIPANCEILFDGGKITGGFINLNGCKLSGMTGEESEYLDSEVMGWAIGQLEFRDGQMKYWSGEEWLIAGAGEYYSKAEVEEILKDYRLKSESYTKTEVEDLLKAYRPKSESYTKDEVNALLNNYVTKAELAQASLLMDKRLEEIEKKAVTLDQIQGAINKGSGEALSMPSGNDGKITLPVDVKWGESPSLPT